MTDEHRLRRGTPESKAFAERVQVAMEITSRLNALPFGDTQARAALLGELFGAPLDDSVTIYPPLFCDHGLGTRFGTRVFINQGCALSDRGGLTIGDRVLIGPRVTITTTGHPVDLADRYDGITLGPIVIEDDVWVGAAATVCPGVTIGRGSVIGAGAVVATDVAPMTLVTGTSIVERRRLDR